MVWPQQYGTREIRDCIIRAGQGLRDDAKQQMCFEIGSIGLHNLLITGFGVAQSSGIVMGFGLASVSAMVGINFRDRRPSFRLRLWLLLSIVTLLMAWCVSRIAEARPVRLVSYGTRPPNRDGRCWRTNQHRWIPGTIVAVEHHLPSRRQSTEPPIRECPTAGQVGQRRVAGNHQVEVADDRRRVVKIAQAVAEVDQWPPAGKAAGLFAARAGLQAIEAPPRAWRQSRSNARVEKNGSDLSC